ncbi:xanthine dehydrogenase accessory protein XdhC [Candidatus Sumerlaeota bacterium]|nr:xanthine dehydrogenase accessory protein XdhC [Candidatus Sumerlaeota bacterium]
MTTEKSYFEHCVELSAKGIPFVSVTFIASEGSAPQDAGSKMIVTADGLYWGTVGGGKIEARAIEQALAVLREAPSGAPRPTKTLLAHWDLGRDLGMVCGGSLELFFEACGTDTWNIAIFGAGHVALALVSMLLPISCRVTCIDTRREWLDRLPKAAKVCPVLTDDRPACVANLPEGAFVLCLTPGHEGDLAVLQAIYQLGRRFPYIGVIGSRRKASEMRKALLEGGVPPSEVERIHCPVGLPLGTNDPAEIAVSIAAQLLQERDRLARVLFYQPKG